MRHYNLIENSETLESWTFLEKFRSKTSNYLTWNLKKTKLATQIR